MTTPALGDDEMPYVCPGCYAVAGQRCTPGCIDDEMDRKREEALLYGDVERFDEDEDECECPVEGHGIGCPRDRFAELHRVTDGPDGGQRT